VPGKIPWTIVRMWARHHGMSRGEFTLLDACIQEMDSSYLQWWVAQQPPPPPRS
jgi:hypothetical protein